MQTKELIPFRSEIFHPMACLYFLRMSRKLLSCEAFSNEEITTGHWSPSSKYAYFNSTRRGLRSRFWGSMLPSFSLSSLVNKGRIYSFLFQGQQMTQKSGASNISSEISASSLIKSTYSHCCCDCSSTRVSIKHTSSGPLSSRCTWFCLGERY